jgi:hypothetical protein
MSITDPFAVTDPLWQPHELNYDEEFSQPDRTVTGIRDFLRTDDEVKRVLDTVAPIIQQPVVRDDGPTLSHIPGYPG